MVVRSVLPVAGLAPSALGGLAGKAQGAESGFS